MHWRSPIGAATVVAALLLFGCRDSAPPMPEDVLMEGLAPTVEKAITDAFAAARENKNDPELLMKLGYTLHAHKQFAGAADSYARAHHFRPDFASAYARAVALEALGRNDDAIAAYSTALKLEPNHLTARLRFAEAQLAGKFTSVAAAEFRRVVDAEPGNARAHFGLGRTYQQEKKEDLANAEFVRAVEIYPAYGAAHYEIGQFYKKRGDAMLANQHMEKHRQYALVAPSIEDELDETLRKYNAGGMLLLRQSSEMAQVGNFPRALELLQQAVKVEPTLVQAHINLLALYAKDRRFFDADQHFRRAIQLAPNRADAYYNFGVLRFAEEKFEDACRAFEQATVINPRYAEALVNFAFCEENAKRPDEALRLMRAAHAAKPSYKPATFHLGRMLAMRNQLDDAIPLFESLREPVDRDTPTHLMALGTAYQQAKRPADARAQWEHAVSLAQSLNQPRVEAQAKALLAKGR